MAGDFWSCYHLLKPEAGNLIFLYDQPGEHVVPAILVNYLPQMNLDPLLLEAAQILQVISFFQPRRQLVADPGKRLSCDSRFQGWCGIDDQSIVIFFGNGCQECIHDLLGRRSIGRSIHDWCPSKHNQGDYNSYHFQQGNGAHRFSLVLLDTDARFNILDLRLATCNHACASFH